MASYLESGGGACERYEALLEDYLNGELSGADARAVIDHCQRCEGCREALEMGAEGARLLHAALASPDPGSGFARIVMARIRNAETDTVRANFWQPLVSFGWRFAATASLAVFALVSYNAGWGRRPQPKAAASRPMDIFAPEPARAPANGDEVLMMVADSGHAKY